MQGGEGMSNIKYANDGTTSSDRRIHTPSSFARKNLNFVQEIGVLKSLKAHSCIRENMDSYLFFVVIEGSGTVVTGGKTYPVNSGECVFLDCHKHYEHRSGDEDPWKIMWVHFNGREAETYFSLFTEGNECSPVFKPINGISEYVNLIDEIKPLLPEKKVMTEIKTSYLLSDLLFKCMDEVIGDKELTLDEASDLENDDFASLREAVNEHCDEDGLERILSIQYGLQPEKLNEIFKTKYGISLEDYILNRKFNKAKELLRFTIKPIEEIVEESGVKDEELFQKLFIDNEEMTPEEYRKKWAQWIKS